MGPVERVRLLRELLEYVKMLPQKACFGHGSGYPSKDLPKSEKEVDDFIRQRTLLWRETWLVPKIEAMIKDDVQKIKKRKAKDGVHWSNRRKPNV